MNSPIDGASLAAMLAIFVGWFFAETLAVTLGSLQHGVRFFDTSSAIADPSRIFFAADLFAAPADARTLSSSVIRFANKVVHQGGGVVASHVSIGMGGYLAFAGSLALAAQGMRRLLRHAP
jgi:hypothetical protein